MPPDSLFPAALHWTILASSLIISLAALACVVVLLRRRAPAQPLAAPLLDPAPALREGEKNGRSPDEAFMQWSPEMLRQILANELPDTELIVVSNREPYVHEHGEDGIELKVPASGLVSALEPITRTCAGTWIAHGGGSADRETVDRNGHIMVPPDAPAYTLRRVWLSEEEYKGYYLGFANEGLWPLCHIAFTRPIFRAADWECYQAVNRKFAEAVVEEAKTKRPIVLVQDYHFALLPRLIRERLPEAIIITFWHIPWPNSEVFSVCPWREQILDGMLGSSILGFHIQLHCNNFVESVDRFLESRVDREGAAISYGGQTTLVHSYPISIEWPEAEERVQTAAEARRKVLERYGLPPGVKLAVGVERLDYTKGILDRFHALDEFFHQHSDWIGRLVFLQIAAPSRGTLPAYQALHQECLDLVAEINERYGRDGYQPIVLLPEHHDHTDLSELFRAADLCVVSSLHDGMNLVAKEFVAARDDEAGVLVLSAFAGASRELLEALIVNPFDPSGMGEAFFQALTMPPDEQAMRMRRLREVVRSNNVYRWAGSMLMDAARLRQREQFRDLGTSSAPWAATRPPEDNVVRLRA
ncbi:trehalose-6-phosphate synthase [Mesorhizobium sp. LHD-90]|uniref:alpha,alpha-trehalose-phosphate synthase (UDP-forming) n=1 Tax=Mesorhizobium sp. LHD-90 TaxID=3071414 RepID=UPI0027DECE0A|nr:trehalose-6-phosphate synthase [Mesorhizobium sp. LHD-90]MDQ6433900.1 trehalose-6-phosphate synthase [Mesorhizobium sp. LHD-90]